MWPNYRGGPQPGDDGWNPSLSSNTQNQWASYYQNMAPQQVDWASLAQQWIAMKSQGPEMPPGPPQPPPVNHPPAQYHHIPQAPLPPGNNEGGGGGGGEDNMDLEENGDGYEYEEYTHTPAFPDVYHSRAAPRPLRPQHEEYHHHQQQHHHHRPPPGGFHPQHHGRQHHQHPHPQQPPWGHDNWGNHRQPLMGAIPPLMGGPGGPVGPDYNFSSLNAEARKKLPAWIREGLEKMEREKLKKEEEEIRTKLREEKLMKRRQEELERQNEEGAEAK